MFRIEPPFKHLNPRQKRNHLTRNKEKEKTNKKEANDSSCSAVVLVLCVSLSLPLVSMFVFVCVRCLLVMSWEQHSFDCDHFPFDGDFSFLSRSLPVTAGGSLIYLSLLSLSSLGTLYCITYTHKITRPLPTTQTHPAFSLHMTLITKYTVHDFRPICCVTCLFCSAVFTLLYEHPATPF